MENQTLRQFWTSILVLMSIISKVKSNLILRIPKEVGEALDLHKGGEIELELKDMDKIVLHTKGTA